MQLRQKLQQTRPLENSFTSDEDQQWSGRPVQTKNIDNIQIVSRLIERAIKSHTLTSTVVTQVTPLLAASASAPQSHSQLHNFLDFTMASILA